MSSTKAENKLILNSKVFKEHSIVGNARIFSFGRVGNARILSFGTYKKGTLDWSGMESSAQNHHQASSIHYLL